jgi:hypothetical protein
MTLSPIKLGLIGGSALIFTAVVYIGANAAHAQGDDRPVVQTNAPPASNNTPVAPPTRHGRRVNAPVTPGGSSRTVGPAIGQQPPPGIVALSPSECIRLGGTVVYGAIAQCPAPDDARYHGVSCQRPAPAGSAQRVYSSCINDLGQ